jgi:hypothetical protein
MAKDSSTLTESTIPESPPKTSGEKIWEHLQKREFAKAAGIINDDLNELYEKDFKVHVIEKIDKKLIEPIADIFKKISKEAGELATSTITALKEFGKSCKRFGNKILTALGNVCQGFAEVAKNPGKALDNVGKIFIESLQTIRNFALGREAATSQSK